MSQRKISRRQSTKAGGLRTPSGFRFELSGGALCLDFINTRDERPTAQPKELLTSYADLLSWARQAGAATRSQGEALEKGAARRPRAALAALERARSVRENLFSLFSNAAAGRRLSGKGLQSLDEPLAAALARQRLAPGTEGGAEWTWSEGPDLDRVLWPVLRSAADLLTSGDLARVRECAADPCAWLFVDRSKNRSRRWCDMAVCGNRDKVRRHRRRQRRRPAAAVRLNISRLQS